MSAKLFVGGVATAVAMTGSWVHYKATALPKHQRGSFYERIQRVMLAIPATVDMLIHDEFVKGMKHVSLIASLPSKDYLNSDEATRRIVQCSVKHLNPYEDLKPSPLIVRKTSDANFMYAGAAPQLHDVDASHNIQFGNYVRCKRGHIALGRTVIITGTTDKSECEQLRLLSDKWRFRS